MPHPRLFLIDTYGFIFRAYHARARSGAPPMRTSTGLSTEAVFIFTNMLRKLAKTYKPEYIAAVFESIGPTLREQEFAEYKANRAEMPPDLGEQIAYIRRLLDAMRIPILEFRGFEADDVIGTIARRAEAGGFRGGDRIERQGHAAARHGPRLHAQSGQGRHLVRSRQRSRSSWASSPRRWPICWRSKATPIDNIPGAPGIGDKGAKDLIEQFGSVEAALDRAAEVERKMYRESLQNNRERIR